MSWHLSASGLERPRQVSTVLTWIEDRLFPMLRKSGVMKSSVTLLHTSWTDGRSTRKLRVAGITSLEEGRSKVTSGQPSPFKAAVNHVWIEKRMKKQLLAQISRKMMNEPNKKRVWLLGQMFNWWPFLCALQAALKPRFSFEAAPSCVC